MSFFFLEYQVDWDTCTLHQRQYRSVILITLKVLNIGTDRSDLDQTAPKYEQSDQGVSSLIRVYTALLFHLHRYMHSLQ